MKYTAATGLLLLASISYAAQLPTWQMAELTGLDEDAWAKPGTDGAVSYRPAKAGKRAAWTVPAWWGKTFRPPKGTVYVLEVRYKDTVKTPAVFYSHAGLVRKWGHSEVHRFGGDGDGKWKTAHIPISWDLICKAKDSDDTALSVLARGADLPIAEVKVRLARPGDAERFRRETRAWVARAGAERFPDLKDQPKAEPVLPERLKDAPLVPFVRPYDVWTLRSTAPQKGEAGATLKVRMTLDEYEPAPFGVYANGRDLKDVTFSVSELTGPSGKLACRIDLRTAEYAVIQRLKRRRPVGLEVLPVRLWPAHAVDIPAGRSHWFWITLKTDPNRSRPGTYRGAVTITSGRGKADWSADLPIEVEVLPVRLMTVDEINVPMGGCVQNLPPEQEMITYAEHNQRSVHLFSPYLIDLENADGELKLDFTYLDDWMAVVTANRITHVMWFFGNPNAYPDTLTLERQLFRSSGKTRAERNARRREFIDRHRKFEKRPEDAGVLPEVRPLYTQWVQKVAAHAKEKNWPKLLLHPFDEPAKWVYRSGAGGPMNVLGTGPWLKYHFKDAAALIHRASKDVLVAGDIHHAKSGIVFLDDVDVFCTNAIHEDLKLGDKVRAAGKIFWQYKGCQATQAPFIARYSYGFYFGAFRSTGGLIWAMNWGPGFDYNERISWMYSWYTPFGTVTSPAYEGLREGMDDRRLIETFRKRLGKDPQAMAVLNNILRDAVASRVKAGRDTVYDFYAAIDEVAKLARWRDQLLDLLVRAGK